MPNATDPRVLYQYTSMTGLLGIIKGASLWASHIHYLNDRTEQKHLWPVIKTLVQKRLDQPILDEEKHSLECLQPAIEVLLDPSGEGQISSYYVASFSKHRDVLSQWLSYCPRGNGFAVGFRREGLISGDASENNVAKVLYFDRDDPESPLQHLLAVLRLSRVGYRGDEAARTYRERSLILRGGGT